MQEVARRSMSPRMLTLSMKCIKVPSPRGRFCNSSLAEYTIPSKGLGTRSTRLFSSTGFFRLYMIPLQSAYIFLTVDDAVLRSFSILAFVPFLKYFVVKLQQSPPRLMLTRCCGAKTGLKMTSTRGDYESRS